jgi:hypothetical protein
MTDARKRLVGFSRYAHTCIVSDQDRYPEGQVGISAKPETLIRQKEYLITSMFKMADQTISLDRLNINGRVHRLSRRLNITIVHEDDRLTLTNEEFGLVVSAATLEEGIAGVSDELAMLWEVYVEENPANLTKDAIRLRSNLTSLVPAGVSL